LSLPEPANGQSVSESPLVSLVVPLYNESSTLAELVRRIQVVLEKLTAYRWEVIFVNDGSTDGSEQSLTALARQHEWLSVIHLSRNFGHQVAISAGIDVARGEAIILMDGDLQDPPELVEEMLARWQEGYDVVYGTRKHRDGEGFFKRWTASVYYRLLSRMSSVKIPLDTGDFRLMSRPVVDALIQMREQNRFIRGMVSWVGFRQIPVYYERDKRYGGDTKFTVFKMMRFAMDGILSFSSIPLQWITTLGFFISFFSFVCIVYVLYSNYILHVTVKGWTSTMVGILMLGGIQLTCLGMIGEYVARIFDEVRNRPLYIIRKRDE
jgi:glycosyltransferase involved in cell wall biosynthesis